MPPIDMATSAAFTPAHYEPVDRRGGQIEPIKPRQFRIVRADRIGAFADSAVSTDLSPVDEHLLKLAAQQLLHQQTKQKIESRLLELSIDAGLAVEPFSDESASDMRSFLFQMPLTERPAIFLLENGNLRALWRNDHNEQVGLQFLGGGLVQFVMFFRREGTPALLREVGNDLISAIQARISANNCNKLVLG